MRPVILRARRIVFCAAVAGALAFGAGQAFAGPTARVCGPDTEGSCTSHTTCSNLCKSLGSPGGACYQGCCYCA